MSAADRLLSDRRLIRSLAGLFHEQVYLYSVLGIRQIRYAGVFSFGPRNCIWEPWMGPGENGETENYKYSRFPSFFSLLMFWQSR